jgi:hypothetical protein
VMVYPLALQRPKEALHRRVVIPTTCAVHTDFDAPVLQLLLCHMARSAVMPHRGLKKCLKTG